MRSDTVWRAVAEFVEPDWRWLCWLRQLGVLRHRRDAEALVRRQLQRRMAVYKSVRSAKLRRLLGLGPQDPCPINYRWKLLDPSPPTLLAQLLDNDWKMRSDPVRCNYTGLSPRPWQDVAHRYLGLGHYLVLSHSSMLRCYFFRHDSGGNGDDSWCNFVPSLASIRPLSVWQAMRYLAAQNVPSDLVAGE